MQNDKVTKALDQKENDFVEKIISEKSIEYD